LGLLQIQLKGTARLREQEATVDDHIILGGLFGEESKRLFRIRRTRISSRNAVCPHIRAAFGYPECPVELRLEAETYNLIGARCFELVDGIGSRRTPSGTSVEARIVVVAVE
jgi:hypothetical protein